MRFVISNELSEFLSVLIRCAKWEIFENRFLASLEMTNQGHSRIDKVEGIVVTIDNSPFTIFFI
jgi:hypothetical protein